MIKNVKSIYILKNIFSFLKIKTKFKFMKYNKSLQSILEIGLIDYRRFSKRYIIYEKNGKGKEYDGFEDVLIYEGDFLNGERSGKGKILFKNGKINYIGQFLDGKRHGLGKEYDSNFELKFIGNYLYGGKNGKGKEIDDINNYNKIIFEGEFRNGKKWTGKGYDNYFKELFELKDGKGYVKQVERRYNLVDFLIYEGDYLNGVKHGKGKEYIGDKNKKIIFEGEYFNGKRWTGKAYNEKGELIYELKEGTGFVIEFYSNVMIFQSEVEYIRGEKNGIEKINLMETYRSTLDLEEEFKLKKGPIISEAEYKNGVLNGISKEYRYSGTLKSEIEYINGVKIKGKEFDSHGNLIFDGEYLYGDKLKGKFYINRKLEYEGEFLLDKKWSGKGYDKYGNVIYELINGNGNVKEYTSYGGSLIYEGEYLNGIRNGKGKEYENCKVVFEGEYENGKRKNKNYFCYIY